MISQALKQSLNDCNWEIALKILEEYPEPLDNVLLEKKAWCYSRLGKYEKAIDIYNELLQIQPNSSKLLYSLGYQFYAQDDYANAIVYFEKALEYYPEYLKVRYKIAYAYLQLSGTEQQWTKDVYWKAINHLKDSHKIYNSFLEEEKEKEKSTYADICALHGKTMLGSVKYVDKAIELFTLSLSLRYDENVQYQLAKGFYLKKDYESALDKLPQGSKSLDYVQELKGLILSETCKYEESNEVLFKVLKHKKKDYILQRISQNYLCMGNKSEALKYSLQAIAADRKNYKNFLLCGRVNKELEQYRTAVNYLEKARTIKQKKYNSDEPDALRLIEEIDAITESNPYDVKVEVDSAKCQTGYINKYNGTRGFGFIKSDSNGADYFFHITSIKFKQKPIVGMRVSFEITQTEKGNNAINIEVS